MPDERTTKPRKAPRTLAEASTTPPAKKKPVNARRKGAEGERELARLLTEAGYPASRGQQRAGGADSPDVRCDALAWLHLEVKVYGACQMHAPRMLAQWDAQAIRDAGPAKLPVVVHRWARSAWWARLLVPGRAPVWMPLADLLTPAELEYWRRVARQGGGR